MKSRMSIPPQYRKKVQEQIKEEVNAYLNKQKIELAKRFCYASIITLDDIFRNRFGKKQKTLNHNYQRFASWMQYIILDHINDCYKWGDSDDPEAASKAMEKELEDRGIHIDFE